MHVPHAAYALGYHRTSRPLQSGVFEKQKERRVRKKKQVSAEGASASAAGASGPPASAAAPAVASAAHVALARQMLVNRMGSTAAATAAVISEKAAARAKQSKAAPKESELQGAKSRDKSTPKFRAL